MPRCSAKEASCIRDAIRLARDTITKKLDLCFIGLRRCPDGAPSQCTPDVLRDCLLSVLERTTYFCALRGIGGCHRMVPGTPRNAAHTDSLCMSIKRLGARGVSFPGLFECEPCRFPFSYANDCTACPDPILLGSVVYLCRDAAPNQLEIDSYCSTDKLQKLAVILVHEAAHSCVGGHDTTGRKSRTGERSCDKCRRNDSFDIEEEFSKCVG